MAPALPHPSPDEADNEARLELVPDVVEIVDEDDNDDEATVAAEEVEEEVEVDEPSEPSAADPLKLYVRQIGDGRLLTPSEERELARRKDEGDEDAKRKLIESNL